MESAPGRRYAGSWTVGRMLTAGFAVALVALAVVGGSAYIELGRLSSGQKPLNHVHRVVGGIGKLNDLVNQLDRTGRSYRADPGASSQLLFLDTARALNSQNQELHAQLRRDPASMSYLAKVRALTGPAIGPATGDTAREDDFRQMTTQVDGLRDHEEALLDRRIDANEDAATDTRRLILAVSLGTALLVAAVGRWNTRRITAAAHEVTEAAGRILAGDLTHHAPVSGPAEMAHMAQAVNASMTAMATARDEAVAATAAKSSFLATMSHEIRTPMNAVIGGASLLSSSGVTSEQHELVGIIRNSAESLLVIINDILDFSKIEAGELVLDEQPVNLRGCVDDAVNLVALTADAKGLRLSVTMAPDCPATIVADETRLRQILVNLLGNAVKFTDGGGVGVDVRTEKEGEVGVQLVIAVRDTGIGIPADQVERLFAAFSQVDASATRSREGTGLGLAISRRLATAMGGRIAVESTPGQGSTFTLFAYAGLPGPDTSENPVSTADLPAPGRPLKVLLAEDNPINQRVAELMLTRRGHRLDIVDNGADAVEAVARTPYDLVLMDVRMPRMDGLTATRTIRADPPAHGTPRLVALTANATLDDRAAARAAGLDDFLAKPIREDDLDVVLAAAAGHADTDRTLRAAGSTGLDDGEEHDIRACVTSIAGDDFANQVRFADILLAFAQRLPGVLDDLADAARAGDHDRLDQLAHGLKGSSATLGAHRLAAACARVEECAQHADTAAATTAITVLRVRADSAERAVTAVAQELTTPAPA